MTLHLDDSRSPDRGAPPLARESHHNLQRGSLARRALKSVIQVRNWPSHVKWEVCLPLQSNRAVSGKGG